MKKKKIISAIQNIISKYGSFGTGEVEADCSPCVNEMGGLVALAEHFNLNNVDVEVYEPSSFSSDSMESYILTYEELSKDNLAEILLLAENWEADQIQTEKRISN